MATAASSKKTTRAPEEESEFSFRELLMKSVNYVPLFVIFLLVSFIIAVVYIHYQTPIYSSSIKLLLKDPNSRISQTTISDQVLPQVYFNSKTTLANETEVLRSQTLMERVVLHQQLNTRYYSVGKVNTIELFDPNPQNRFVQFSGIQDSSKSYSVTFKIKENNIYVLEGDREIKTVNHRLVITPQFNYIINISDISLYKPDYKYKAIWIPTGQMAGAFAGALSISPLSRDASILIISTSSQVAARSEMILNGLVNEYNSFNIEQTNTIADNTIHFIDDRLLVISGELNTVENGLKEFKQRNALDIAAKGGQEVGIATELEEKLNEQELQMNVADMVADYVNNSRRKFELVPSNLGIGDATLGALVSKYNEGVLQRQELLKTLGEQNLEVKALESQLDDLRAKIVESVNNVKAVYRDAQASAYNRYKATLANIQEIPGKEKQLLEIERQQGIKEKLYLYLLQKREESAISRAAAIGKSAPVDTAKSGGPVNIKNGNIYMLALFAGLGIPLLIVYLMDILNDRVTTRDEIIKYTDAPIIGEISHFRDEERKIIAGKTRGILPEQFRIVRTNLRYFLPKDKQACILVTSTMPGEGKTFISLNLAGVLAISGKKTVLVGFDLRRPKIGEAMKITGAVADLPAFLAGEASVKDVIGKVEGMQSLYAVTNGFIPPNPAELLLSDRVSELFTYLKANFDYIVIDTPPLGLVSDAKVLSEFADLSLYIVRQRYTQRKQLKILDTLYKENKMPNLAMVVNDVKVKGIRSYYGYGYTYGSYGYDYSIGYGGYGYANGKKSKWKKFFKLKR